MKELVSSWPGLMSLAVVAAALVTGTAVLLVSRLRGPSASLAQVIQDVEKEPAHTPSADWKGKAIL
jgi:hypothetical protein